MTLVHRVLFVSWRSPLSRGIHTVARLLLCERPTRWELAYVEGAHEAAELGFVPFLEFPDLERVYESAELFPLFQNRLMPSKRPDYADFLTRLDLPKTSEAPIPILARSGGRRETDKLEVFGLPSFDPRRGRFTYLFFLRGVRHVPGAEERLSGLHDGDRLGWRRERDNPVDKLAVVVERPSSGPIGWVPATLCTDLALLIDSGSQLEIYVARKNPPPAPVHERLLCRLEATTVAGFTPFASRRYEPISGEATRIDIRPIELVA